MVGRLAIRCGHTILSVLNSHQRACHDGDSRRDHRPAYRADLIADEKADTNLLIGL